MHPQLLCTLDIRTPTFQSEHAYRVLHVALHRGVTQEGFSKLRQSSIGGLSFVTCVVEPENNKNIVQLERGCLQCAMVVHTVATASWQSEGCVSLHTHQAFSEP